MNSARRVATTELVRRHRPRTAAGVAAQGQILTTLRTAKNPFSRQVGPTHLTASAVVVGSPGTVLLLHKVAKVWLQPGGHIDADELPLAAALRETEEETGLRCAPLLDGELLHLDVHATANDHVHLDLRFLVRAAALELRPGVDESPAVRWFSWDAARAAVCGDELVHALDDAQAQALR